MNFQIDKSLEECFKKENSKLLRNSAKLHKTLSALASFVSVSSLKLLRKRCG
jgi:hypothetical protein